MPATRRVRVDPQASECASCVALAGQLPRVGSVRVCPACGGEVERVSLAPAAARVTVAALLRELRALQEWEATVSGPRSQALTGIVGTGNRGTKGVWRAQAEPGRAAPAAPRAQGRLLALRGTAAHRVCTWLLAHPRTEQAIDCGAGRLVTLSLEAAVGYALAPDPEDQAAWARHLVLKDPKPVERGAGEVGRALLLAAARAWFGLAPAGEAVDGPGADRCRLAPAAKCQRPKPTKGAVAPGTCAGVQWKPEGDGWVMLAAWRPGRCACVQRGGRSGRAYARADCGACRGAGDVAQKECA